MSIEELEIKIEEFIEIQEEKYGEAELERIIFDEFKKYLRQYAEIFNPVEVETCQQNP